MISPNNVHVFESDFLVREMIANLGLHMPFGSVLSVEMLLTELARKAQEARLLLPIKKPSCQPLP